MKIVQITLQKEVSKNYVIKTNHQHPYTVLQIGRITFFLVNRVEHKIEPERVTGLCQFGVFLCIQLDLRQEQALKSGLCITCKNLLLHSTFDQYLSQSKNYFFGETLMKC